MFENLAEFISRNVLMSFRLIISQMQQLFQQLGEIEYRILKFQINTRWDTWELKNLVLKKEKVLNKIKLKELEIKLKELEKDIKKI